MTSNLLLDSFELLSEAPNGVQRIRELILQLAVQGKLVPQDPNDEPASALLEKIKAERERLVKGGREKRHDTQQLIPLTHVPHKLPDSWVWTHLSDVGRIVGGGTPRSDNPAFFAEDAIPWLTPADLYGFRDKYVTRGRRDITAEGLRKSSAQLLPVGTVLFSSRAPIGYVAIAANEVSTNQGFKSCVPYVTGMSEYILYFLRSAAADIDRTAPGTTFREVSGKRVSQVLFPLPPLSEQKRIVTKLDQLMALCDDLEARQKERADARVTLNQSCLDALTTSDGDATTTAWHRIRDNFDLLYDTTDTVDALRQTILQLAVQGKLVPQDPNDEPASVLLKRIKAEKERLVKDGKIKEEKPLPPVKSKEVPYVLPIGWEWGRFSEVAMIASRLVKPADYPDLPHVAPNNIEKGTGRLLHHNSVAEDRVRSANHLFFSGQILYSKIRPNLNKATLAPFGGLCSADMYPVTPFIDPGYLLRYMLSETFVSMAVKSESRVAMPKINQGELTMIPVAVPPASEQLRIVNEVDRLMALCDDLEEKLKQAQKDGERLMDAVVRDLSGAA